MSDKLDSWDEFHNIKNIIICVAMEKLKTGYCMLDLKVVLYSKEDSYLPGSLKDVAHNTSIIYGHEFSFAKSFHWGAQPTPEDATWK